MNRSFNKPPVPHRHGRQKCTDYVYRTDIDRGGMHLNAPSRGGPAPPRAPPRASWPGGHSPGGIHPGLHAKIKCPGWGEHSDARVIPHSPPRAGYRILYIRDCVPTPAHSSAPQPSKYGGGRVGHADCWGASLRVQIVATRSLSSTRYRSWSAPTILGTHYLYSIYTVPVLYLNTNSTHRS